MCLCCSIVVFYKSKKIVKLLYVLVWYGPHKSMCNRSKHFEEVVVLVGKGSLDCLAMRHNWQKKGCLVEKCSGIEIKPFIFTERTWPSLEVWADTLFLSSTIRSFSLGGKQESWAKVFSSLATTDEISFTSKWREHEWKWH